MFQGTINASHVHPREVIKQALSYNAAGVILTHNHPSGNVEPSQADCEITEKLQHCLRNIDVNVVDHIIIGNGQVFSFAQRELL